MRVTTTATTVGLAASTVPALWGQIVQIVAEGIAHVHPDTLFATQMAIVTRPRPHHSGRIGAQARVLHHTQWLPAHVWVQIACATHTIARGYARTHHAARHNPVVPSVRSTISWSAHLMDALTSVPVALAARAPPHRHRLLQARQPSRQARHLLQHQLLLILVMQCGTRVSHRRVREKLSLQTIAPSLGEPLSKNATVHHNHPSAQRHLPWLRKMARHPHPRVSA